MSPSNRPVLGSPNALPTVSASTCSRQTRQEIFTLLLPNFARDQRRMKASAAAKRLRRPARVRPRRRSLFGPLRTRRWFRQSAVGLRVSSEALREVDRAMERFEELVLDWLRQVMEPRRRTSLEDVLAVLRRSGVAGTEGGLRQLIRHHLPQEQQRELVRVAESGRLYPATDPLSGALVRPGTC